jgi:hypothetical protein
MSHWSERTAVIAPVATVAEAADAIGAGAQFVDPGTDEALASALRGGGLPMLDGPVIRVPASEVAGDEEGAAGGGAGGRRVLVDVDGWGTPAAAGAVAAVCAWRGVRLIRTRHVAEVRRCLDMTESILGIRPPAWAVRGLG